MEERPRGKIVKPDVSVAKNCMIAELQEMNNIHRTASSEAQMLLVKAGARMRAVLDDEVFMEKTSIEVTTTMRFALERIEAAVAKLKAVTTLGKRTAAVPGGPTRQQGLFLAFIREYMMRNSAGVAPTHADFQRFFNLTPPSVNSMLIRLERRGFIRRIAPATAHDTIDYCVAKERECVL